MAKLQLVQDPAADALLEDNPFALVHRKPRSSTAPVDYMVPWVTEQSAPVPAAETAALSTGNCIEPWLSHL